MTLAERMLDALPEVADEVRPCAVAWIDDGHAKVVLMGPDGRISTRLVERGTHTEAAYLAEIVRAMGERERVVILGPGPTRLALEREYVAIHHRPDRLVDVEPAGHTTVSELVERLQTLAG